MSEEKKIKLISSSPEGAILAVDFGLKRVGLAVCDPHRKVAVGAGLIVGKQGRALSRSVMAEAQRRNVMTLLIGSPPEGAREVEPVIAGADILSRDLEKKGFEIKRWDESYTTSMALSIRRNIGGKGKKEKEWIDEASAIILLQSYIDAGKSI